MAAGDLRLVYSVVEAAELLGIGRSTAYDLIARGELSTTRLGSRVVVSRPTLTALLGVEPPLPGELEARRRAIAHPATSPPAPKRATRRRQPALAEEQAHLPFTT
jgi:excisionase family DNA binding protein